MVVGAWPFIREGDLQWHAMMNEWLHGNRGNWHRQRVSFIYPNYDEEHENSL